MKKLSLKNLKVVKMSDQEKATITGGCANLTTSNDCNAYSGPYVSWCHSCG
jgi:hypothetical protein